MGAKLVTTILTILIGVGAALAMFWVLNKIAELLPPKYEERFKPYFYILPAYAAIVIFVVYPAVLTVT